MINCIGKEVKREKENKVYNTFGRGTFVGKEVK